MASMVQMNVRIPEELKDMGDRRLEELGYRPSEAVRAFYRFVTNPSTTDEELNRMIAIDEEQARKERLEEFRATTAELRKLYQDFKEANGIPDDVVVPSDRDRELARTYMIERAIERGWLDE